MPRPTTDSPWARYEPRPDDPWDLRKVAHLHRRAGFGATRAELLRDLAAGPEASVERLFHPPAAPHRGRRGDRRPAPDGADVVEPRPAQGLLAQPHPPRARPAPREADPVLARPLRHQQQEGRVGRAHGPAERDAANPRPGRLRRAAGGDHRRPGHARLARRGHQQEGEAQRELRPRVPRAVHPGRRALHRARHPRGRPGLHRLGPAGFPRRLPGDAGLHPRPHAGRRRAQDIPRPDRALGAVRHRPDHPRAPRGRDLPGAQALPVLRQRVRHARPRADRAPGRRDQDGTTSRSGRSWRSSSARGTSTPARSIASGSSRRSSSARAWCGCSRSRARRSTRWRCRPPATRRARSCSPRPTSRAGSAARSGSTAARCSSAPTGPPTSSGAAPRTACRRSTRSAWAARYKLAADRAAGAFVDLLLQGDLGDEARRLALDAGRDGSPDGLRKALQRLANCPEFQLA